MSHHSYDHYVSLERRMICGCFAMQYSSDENWKKTSSGVNPSTCIFVGLCFGFEKERE